MTDEESAWLKKAQPLIEKSGRIPGLDQIRAAVSACRVAADALEVALEFTHQMARENWPICALNLDENIAECFECLLSNERDGAKWTVEDLRNIAAEIDPDTSDELGSALWVSMLKKGEIQPTGEEELQDRWLMEYREIVETQCSIPTTARIKAVAVSLRQGADALKVALADVHEMRRERWPIACDMVDEHMADRFEFLLDEGPKGSKRTAEKLRELADDLDGNPCGIWVSLVANRRLLPTSGLVTHGSGLTPLGREAKARLSGQTSTRPRPATDEFTLSQEWRTWMERLAKHGGLPHNVLMQQSLEAFAKSIGFEEPPPS